jgi:hypothetical protein
MRGKFFREWIHPRQAQGRFSTHHNIAIKDNDILRLSAELDIIRVDTRGQPAK